MKQHGLGGCVVINLESIEIDSSLGATIPGIYAAIEAADKPTLLEGINNDGTEMKPRYVAFDVSGTDFVGYLDPTTTITVDDDDLVMIESVAES